MQDFFLSKGHVQMIMQYVKLNSLISKCQFLVYLEFIFMPQKPENTLKCAYNIQYVDISLKKIKK